MDVVQASLINRMLEPDFYDHPVSAVDHIETHISHIFLAGDFAYKLKKPVDFGFLDFSTREKRRHFCHEELRLNRRFAPSLYLEVCIIGGSSDQPTLGGEPPLDYLVKMRRFPCRAQLDRFLEDGRLTSRQMEAFAVKVADFHQQTAIAAPTSEFGSEEAVIAPILENFNQLAPILPESCTPEQFHALESWSRNACKKLRNQLQLRKREGFIRECHGDLHLANMIWWNEKPLLFDCIEFNANLRWIDLVNDIAFLAMDLDDRGETILGWYFLNRYLQQSGDYHGVKLLSFYKVYRAMVRAKVTCMRLAQPGLPPAEAEKDRQLANSYLELASRYIQPRQPQLIITHGLSGSGKTSLINDLAPRCGAVRIHSDSERKRLTGLNETSASDSPVGGGIYTSAVTERTYNQLVRLAKIILQTGRTVMVDATFLRQRQRQQMRQLAEQLKLPFRILDFPIPEAELRRRLERRQQQPDQLSEATGDVLDFQLRQQEALTPDEQQVMFRILPDSPVDWIASLILPSRATPI